MKREVFYISVEYSKENFDDSFIERIFNLPNYSVYFPTYESAQNYLKNFIDPDKEKYGDYPHHEYSIHKVWIDEDQ